MGRIILGLTIICLSNVAKAGIDKCKTYTNQTDLNKCASRVLSESDAKLGKIYSNYQAELSPDEKNRLRESQKLWVQFKEKDCSFEASPVSKGSMYDYVLSSCLVNRTDKRITELENMTSCKNGTEPGCL